MSQQSIKTELIRDTVFVERTIYLDKEDPEEMIVVNDGPPTVDTTTQSLPANDLEKQIFIRNNNSQKHEKKRKLRFKFGGSKPSSNKVDYALKTEL